MQKQPDTLRIEEPRYDALELIPVDDHLVLIQVTEDGEPQMLAIGPQQQMELLKVLQQRLGGR